MDGAPPEAVMRAFGVKVEPVALPGGEGLSYRAGPIVLKCVHDPAEAAWIQALLSRLETDDVRVAAPVPALDGRWIVDSWAASQFVPGLQPVAPRWDLVIEWGLRFGAAADGALPTDRSALDERTHRWAIADRVAWGETTVETTAEAGVVQAALVDLLLPEPSRVRRFVHGDLTGNVFVDRTGRPVVLDVSPYLRDPRWAAAIVVADAVLWHGADRALAREFAVSPADCDLLGRALIFRLVAEQLAVDPRHGARLAPVSPTHRGADVGLPQPTLRGAWRGSRRRRPAEWWDDGRVAAEERLEGGWQSEATRMGDLVLRRSGPQSEAVIAWLRHLHSVGVGFVPEPVGTGFADDGREQLVFIEGEIMQPRPWSDDAIGEIGRMLRQVHDAAPTFPHAPAHRWRPSSLRALAGGRPVIGHCDLGPWNILARDGAPVRSSTGTMPAPWDMSGISPTRYGSTSNSTTTTSRSSTAWRPSRIARGRHA